jgi:hypothetical protein
MVDVSDLAHKIEFKSKLHKRESFLEDIIKKTYVMWRKKMFCYKEPSLNYLAKEDAQ